MGDEITEAELVEVLRAAVNEAGGITEWHGRYAPAGVGRRTIREALEGLSSPGTVLTAALGYELLPRMYRRKPNA